MDGKKMSNSNTNKTENFNSTLDKLTSNWNDITNFLKIEYEIGDVAFKTWITPLKVSYVDTITNNIYIYVPDGEIAIEHIKKKYALFLRTAIREKMDDNIAYEIEFVDVPFNESQISENVKTIQKPVDDKNLLKYTFDTFVKGDNNRFAFNAALSVAENPSNSYNPLFIYGGVGLGKTHLMYSIVNHINKLHPDLKVMYVTSEEFTNDLIENLKMNKNINKEFRDKYRNLDVLLIDDIQFIIGKISTQEEFFHTFNALFNSNKQIVISSDKHPKEFETLEDRLKSRFEQGLIVDIQPPTYETRMAIIKRKAEMEGYQGTKYEISDDVLEFIATHIKSNIRELEGALTKVVAYSRLSKNETIDVALVETVLKELISPDAKREITPELIINTVAEHYKISVEDICSTKKSQDISYPRQIAMYLCRTLTDVSLKSIGTYLGGKDHTTIMHGVDKIKNDMVNNKSLENTIDILTKKISPS